MNQEQTNITTGKQIRHLRTQLGMTQEELAGELNVTRQALSNWERDVNEPDLNMLKTINEQIVKTAQGASKKRKLFGRKSQFIAFFTTQRLQRNRGFCAFFRICSFIAE